LQESARKVEATVTSPDYEALHARYVPSQGEDITWDEFVARGVELIEGARHRFLVLGDLALEGWYRFAPRASQREWEGTCAAAWGCNRSTINKAITLARSPVALPEDAPPTLAYTVLSAAGDDHALAERLMDIVIKQGWSAWDVRNIKILVGEDLLDDWVKPHLFRSGDRLMVRIGDETATVARFEDDGPLSKAGARLLGLKGGF